VRNGNDEEASNNDVSGDKVQGAFQGQKNNVPKEPEEVTVRDKAEFNNQQHLNENSNHVTAPQGEVVVETNDNMSLGGMLFVHTQRAPLPVGPALVRLGNARRNALRRPPRYHTVVQNNGTLDSRIV
jgi:hypothetical protein